MEIKKLENINIIKLINRQILLDEEFKKKDIKTNIKRDVKNNLVAMAVECGEMAQEIKKSWCYWKNNFNYEEGKFIEEMSDYLHFLLQYIYNNEKLFEELKENEFDFNLELNQTINSFSTIKGSEKLDVTQACLHLYLPLSYELLGYEVGVAEIYSLFIAMYTLLYRHDISLGVFLETHHNKFEKNYYERTKENY